MLISTKIKKSCFLQWDYAVLCVPFLVRGAPEAAEASPEVQMPTITNM